MEDMEYTWLMLWTRTVSSEESVGTEGEPAACLRNSSHFSFMTSRSSFSLFSSAVFFCGTTHRNQHENDIAVESLNPFSDHQCPHVYLMLCDALQALLQVVPLQWCAELPDQVLLVGLKVHPEVAYFWDVMIVDRLLVFLCSWERCNQYK